MFDTDTLAATFPDRTGRPLTEGEVEDRAVAFQAVARDIDRRHPAGPFRVDVQADPTGVTVRTVLGDVVYIVNRYGAVWVDTFHPSGTRTGTRTGGHRGALL